MVCSSVADNIDRLLELPLPELLEQEQKWPRLTVSDSNRHPSDSDAELIALTMLKKLRQYDESIPLSSEDLRLAVSLYARLSEFFGTAGGYYNLVLSDSCRRLAASRIGYELADLNSDVFQQAKVLMRYGMRSRPPFQKFGIKLP